MRENAPKVFTRL